MPNRQDRDNFSETNGYRALGTHVHRLRQERGLGLRQAARAAGVDPTWLSRLEQGLYTAPDARSVHASTSSLFLTGKSLTRIRLCYQKMRRSL